MFNVEVLCKQLLSYSPFNQEVRTSYFERYVWYTIHMLFPSGERFRYVKSVLKVTFACIDRSDLILAEEYRLHERDCM